MNFEHTDDRRMLADTLPHDPRLAEVNGKAFVQSDRAGMHLEPFDGTREFLPA